MQVSILFAPVGFTPTVKVRAAVESLYQYYISSEHQKSRESELTCSSRVKPIVQRYVQYLEAEEV